MRGLPPEIEMHALRMFFRTARVCDLRACRFVCRRWRTLARRYAIRDSRVVMLSPRSFQDFGPPEIKLMSLAARVRNGADDITDLLDLLDLGAP